MSKNSSVELDQVYDDERQGSHFNIRIPNTESARMGNQQQGRKESQAKKSLVQIAQDMQSEILLDLQHSAKPEELLSFELVLSARSRTSGIENRERASLVLKYQAKDAMINVLEGIGLDQLGTAEDFTLSDVNGKFNSHVPKILKKIPKDNLGSSRLRLHLYRSAYGAAFILEVVFKMSNTREGAGFLVEAAEVKITNATGTTKTRAKGNALLSRVRIHRPSLFNGMKLFHREGEHGSSTGTHSGKGQLADQYGVFGGLGDQFTKEMMSSTRDFVRAMPENISIQIRRKSSPDEVLTFDFLLDSEERAKALEEADELSTIKLDLTLQGNMRGVFKSFAYEDISEGDEFELLDPEDVFSDKDTLGKRRPPILFGSKAMRKRMTAQMYRKKDYILQTVHAMFQLNTEDNACSLSVVYLRVWIQDYRALLRPRATNV